jgi:hypothetical protein
LSGRVRDWEAEPPSGERSALSGGLSGANYTGADV